METKYVVEVRELPQEDHGGVVERLAQAFGVDVRKAEGLLRRAPGAVTKPISQQEARKVASLFVRAGIAAEVRPLVPEETTKSEGPTLQAPVESTPVAEPPPEVTAEPEITTPTPQAPAESTPIAEPSQPLEEPDASAPAEAPAAEEVRAPEPPPGIDDAIPPDEVSEEPATPRERGNEVPYPEEAERTEAYPPRPSQGPRLLLGAIIVAIIIVILILWLR